MPDLDQELTILIEEEPEGITRLLLALTHGTIRGALQPIGHYYECGPYGVMFDDPVVAQHKTFAIRTRLAIAKGKDWERLITPLEIACALFVEGEVTPEHQHLIDQITQIHHKETTHA